ncbi:30S ribosomal protein S6 [Mycoplasma sp. ATU-Cv-703]|uniref:30S ribosomal protein S6 n=1 Tax=Mycoplasma sp. ATU-Cv-703 TaxID=2498595 RepID=UPI000FDE7DB6
MPKYEILLIVDPKADSKQTENLAQEVFKTGSYQISPFEKNQLAYPINNSLTAKYILINIETDGSNIAEFTRRANLNKNVWRYLVVNLDQEKTDRKPRPGARTLQRTQTGEKPRWNYERPSRDWSKKTASSPESENPIPKTSSEDQTVKEVTEKEKEK